MAYIDGFVLPVPVKKLAEYKKMAKLAAKVWKEHGVLAYVEALGDDVPNGKLTSFPMAVKLKKGETVVFAHATYKSRAHRDRIMKKIMADPRMQFDWSKAPFDSKRMFWGGFKPLVSA